MERRVIRQAPDRRTQAARLFAACCLVIAAAAGTGAVLSWRAPAELMPTLVYAAPRLEPVVVHASPSVPLASLAKAWKGGRAKVGEPVQVQLTAYCLQGTTRRGRWVRDGVVAADPRVFPLGSYVELFEGSRYLGRFLVDDTGGLIKGAILDVWRSSCRDARIFGRRKGTATMVAVSAP